MRDKVSFGRALKLFWSNYVNFKGRSRRSEYWYATLWNLIFVIPGLIGLFIGFMFAMIGSASHDEAALTIGGSLLILGYLYCIIFALATLIPNLAILVRRFHDLSFSMWIPICYIVVTFVINLISNIISTQDKWLDNVFVLIFIYILLAIQWIYSVILLVMVCFNGKKETNKYGPSPKFTEYATEYKGENHNPVDKTKSN
ncbi:DUF805 domain-containing protein [Staphylococcus caprae]|uniref:DUF805 domain-containing protein n=1 Tax=Staphylococcus caprae TaxID=29380 RepID=UPI0024B4F4E0|nr:DUF805 domain-containing protein [Staphylococcus caprae]MDI9230844.1 DUF805 domain-containing protein [Staphylococcus caprae]